MARLTATCSTLRWIEPVDCTNSINDSHRDLVTKVKGVICSIEVRYYDRSVETLPNLSPLPNIEATTTALATKQTDSLVDILLNQKTALCLTVPWIEPVDSINSITDSHPDLVTKVKGAICWIEVCDST